MLLKDGRPITDASIWNDILPAVGDESGRAFSLIQAYLKNGDESGKPFSPSSECDTNDVPGDGETDLARAVAKNCIHNVELLLQRGADPNMKEKKIESTPLIEASKEGYDGIVKLLLQYGASVTQTTSTRYTALHYAAANGQLECVRLLVEHRSPLEEQNENGCTPLMEATSNGHIDVARYLIERGANINTHSTEFKESALTLASYKGHAEMVNFLLDAGAYHEHRTDEMHTALMEAAMEGHVDVASLLLAHGANVNIPQDSFESPLTLAACGGHTELAHLLLGYEADIEEVNDEGYTPLMEASREGHEETVALLLAAGADVNAKTEETQETALTLAACGGFIDVCEMLLKAGADIEVGNNRCSTPLMEAAQEGHIKLVRRLLQQGANVNATTASGDSALHHAAENGHVEVCRELLNWGASLDMPANVEEYKTPLMNAARAGHVEVVRLLVECGSPVDQTTLNNDATALSLACNGGHVQVVEYLLKSNANPHHFLNDGCTMLIEAARYGSPAVLRLILDYPNSISAQQVPSTQDGALAPPPPPPSPPSAVTGGGGSSTLPQLTHQQQLALQHQLQNGGLMLAADATEAIYQQAGAVALHARGASGQPATTHYLQEALTNAYRQGFADGAASRAPLAFQQNIRQSFFQHIPPTAAMPLHVAGTVDPSGDSHSFSAEAKGSGTQPDAATARGLPVGDEPNGGDVIGDPSDNPTPQELGSRVLALLDMKANDPGFLRRLSKAMCASEGSSRAGSSTGGGSGRENIDEAEAYARIQQILHTFTAGGRSGSTGITASAADGASSVELIEACRAAVGELFAGGPPHQPSPAPPPPTNTASGRDSSVSSTTSGSSDSNSSVVSSSTQVIDAPTAMPPKRAAAISQQQHINIGAGDEQSVDIPSQIDQSPIQAFTPSSSSCSSIQSQSAASSAVPPQDAGQYLQQHLGGDPRIAENPEEQALFDQYLNCANINPHQAIAFNQSSQSQQQLALTHQQQQQHASAIPGSVAQHQLPLSHQQVSINACIESSSESALTLACTGGFVDFARLLLERGADKEHKDKKSHTPLHAAVYTNQCQIVSLLLDFKVDIESQVERTKDTALSIACSHGRLEIAEELLNRGANREHRNFSDYTPLSLAASGGFVEVIHLLLQHGAEINSRTGSKLGISPLMLASMNGYTDAVRVLLERGSDINAQIETNRNTALTLACFQGQHEVVRLLVEKKANIEHRAKTGLTPLMEAASGNHVKVGHILLEHGADVNAPPVLSSKDTALTIAADKGKTEFVNLLLNHDAKVEARNKKGATPLWLACNGGHLEVVERLIAAGADVNSQDNRKVSCLMAAFRKGHVKVVNLLVQHVTQFPSDKDCLRHIKVITTEKDLADKCQLCRKSIATAKEKQEGEARKNADVLLEQIEQEEEERANKEAVQARKRERKRNKRKAKQETAAAAAAAAEAEAKARAETKAKADAAAAAASLAAQEKKRSPAPPPSDTVSQTAKKKGKPGQIDSAPSPSPETEVLAEPYMPEQPKASQQTTEAKREKHRNKKQAQRTTKRAEAAAAAASTFASSGPPSIPSSIPPVTLACGSAPLSCNSIPDGAQIPTTMSPAHIGSYEPSASFDNDLDYWETFDASLDSANMGGNATEWLLVQPGGGSKGHRNPAVSDNPTNASDWKTTGVVGGSALASKRKVVFSVSKHDIGKIIGQGGAVVSALRNMTGITIDIEGVKGDDAIERKVFLRGPGEMVEKTHKIIRDLLNGDLAGNDVIARAKGCKMSPAAPSTSSSSNSFSPNVIPLATTTIGPSPRSSSTTARKMDALTTPVKPSQLMPIPQTLMTKFTTNPVGVKTTSVASTAANGASAKTSTSGGSATGVSNTWNSSKSSVTQKGNFAAVAAAGVVQKANGNRKSKPTISAAGTPVSLLSVTFASLMGNESCGPIFSNAPMPSILDDQSFPPLSTATSTGSALVASTGDGKEVFSSKPSEPTQRKMSLPTPQTDERLPIGQPHIRATHQQPPLSQSIGDPAITSAFARLMLPQRSMAPSSAATRPQLSPIGSSRPFARAPGSERSAYRSAQGAAMAAAATAAPSLSSSLLNPMDSVGKYNNKPFGSDTDLFAPPKVPQSLAMTLQSTNQPQGPGFVPLDSFQLSQHQRQQQHQLPPPSNNNSNQFPGNPMWSDFGGSGVGGCGSSSSDAFGKSFPNYAPSNQQQQVPATAPSMSNYAQLFNSIGASASGSGLRGVFEDQQMSPLFPPHLQSSYRLSQQSGGLNKFGAPPPPPDLSGYSGGPRASAAFPLQQQHQQQQQRGDFSLFNGVGTSVAGPNLNNPHAAFQHSRLAQMLNPTMTQHQQQQPKPLQQQQQQQQSAFLHHQQHPHHQTSQFGLGMPSHQSNDHNSYMTGLSSYSGGSSGRDFGTLPTTLQAPATQPHTQPAPIGAERRRAAVTASNNPRILPPQQMTATPNSASAFGGGGPSAAMVTNQAMMALLMQQQQQQQETGIGGGAWPPQQQPPLQSSHQTFWSQQQAVGGGLGSPAVGANHGSSTQHSLLANSAAAVAALANLCAWPNQTTGSGSSSGGGGGAAAACNWMLHPPFSAQPPPSSPQSQPSQAPPSQLPTPSSTVMSPSTISVTMAPETPSGAAISPAPGGSTTPSSSK